jgi:hypothetical protein
MRGRCSRVNLFGVQRSQPLGPVKSEGGRWHFHPISRNSRLESNGEGWRLLIIVPGQAASGGEENYVLKCLSDSVGGRMKWCCFRLRN